MKTKLRAVGQRFKLFSPLLAAPAALLLSQGQAKALVTYNIYESGGNVVVQASGSLNLTGVQTYGTTFCGTNGAIISSYGLVCTGTDPGSGITALHISGPTFFDGSVFQIGATSVSGIYTQLYGDGSIFQIDPAYVSNTPIVGSATFNGTTLASLGFTTTGLIGTWALLGTSETIQVFLDPPQAPPAPAAAAPGPLPLLGAGATFGFGRRLRKRIATPSITPPQA